MSPAIATTDEHALRLIAAGRIVVDPATGVVLVDGKPRGFTDRTNGGYNRVHAQGVTMMAHRIVWMFVHGPISAGRVINHRDGNRLNNRIDNLEAITVRQNNQHAHGNPNYRGDPVVLVPEKAEPEGTEWLMGARGGGPHKVA